jgi:hypothetical protein
MITPMENVNAGNIITSLYPLQTIGDATLLVSLATLAIFVWLALRSRDIKSFQFQISIFIAFYSLGEIIESDRIAISSIFPPDIGSQIHVASATFFTIMVWLRFYYAERRGKKMVESDMGGESGIGGDGGGTNNNSGIGK